jgi:hypothetical protein
MEYQSEQNYQKPQKDPNRVIDNPFLKNPIIPNEFIKNDWIDNPFLENSIIPNSIDGKVLLKPIKKKRKTC